MTDDEIPTLPPEHDKFRAEVERLKKTLCDIEAALTAPNLWQERVEAAMFVLDKSRVT